MVNPVNFDSFGPKGPEFTYLSGKSFELAARRFPILKAYGGIQQPDLVSAARALCSHETMWWDHLPVLSAMFAQGSQELAGLWSVFRLAFRPPFRPSSVLSGDMVGLKRRLSVVGCIHGPPPGQTDSAAGDDLDLVLQIREQLNPVCYGPFTEEQLSHLVAHHRRIVDLGGGSGYAVYVFRQRGIDAVGLESGRYRMRASTHGEVLHAPIDEIQPWSAELRKSGHMIRGSVSHLDPFRDHSLLISWPEGGAAFVAEGLKRYRELGGRRFLMKLGGFVGFHSTIDPQYSPPTNPGRNMVKLFEELAEWWGPPPVAPAFNPLLFNNNLIEFEVLDKPRTMWWEEQGPKSETKTPKQLADERRRKRKGTLNQAR